jgi:DNA replication protein DnaC
MSNDIVSKLKELKLHGMAHSWFELSAQSRMAEFDAEHFMLQLLKAETAEREVRSIAYQMTVAKFPAHRDLHGFNFTESRVDEALVRQLHTLAFLRRCAQSGVHWWPRHRKDASGDGLGH